MKKILSIIALCALAVNCFATGAEGVNPPQSGVITVTTNGAATLFYTNAFPFAYQSVPVVVLYNLGVAAATPFTNTVTTTNFVVELATPTNTTITWQSYAGTPRIYAWTPTNQTAGVATNITFPVAYAYPPVVVATGMGAASNAFVNVYGITTTNFNLYSQQVGTNQVIVFGITAAPSQSASTAPGQNNVNN